MPIKKTERRIQFNRANILETAERLFSEKGVRETTMDDISKAAEYSKSTIYVYFKSKEEIYHHIIFNHMSHLQEIVERCMNTGDTFEQIYFKLCDQLAELYVQDPQFFGSMMEPISTDEKEMSEHEILRQLYELGEAVNDSLILLFQKGVQEEYLRPDLLILPAVYTVWASLANIILIANQKEQYFEKRMGVGKSEFLQYGFQLLLLSIRKG